MTKSKRTEVPPAPFWIVSYPKSGNTWVRFLLAAYYSGGFFDLQRTRLGVLDSNRYFYEVASPKPLEQLTSGEWAALRGSVLLHIVGSQLPGRAWIKSHSAQCLVGGFPLFPRQFVDGVIYIVRDPRDVVVSLADHLGKTIDEAIDFMALEEATIDDGGLLQCISTWGRNVLSWVREEERDVLVVRYEDLLEDTASALARILYAVGEDDDLERDRIERSVQAVEFSRLRAMEEAGGFGERSPQQERFFRSGRAGAWREVLSPEQAARVEDHFGEVMEEVGYHVSGRMDNHAPAVVSR